MHFSFRSKLGFSVAVLTVLLTGGSLFYLYWNIYTLIWSETQDKLKSIGKVGSFMLDREKRKDLQKLIQAIRERQPKYTQEQLDAITPGGSLDLLSEEDLSFVNHTPEFVSLNQVMRQIKESTKVNFRHMQFIEQFYMNDDDPSLINYTYILVPIPESPDKKILQFVVDANFEELDLNKNGVIDDNEQPAHAGSLYNATKFEGMIKAFKGKAEADSEYESDQWSTSLSAYIPIKDEENTVIAVLGVDMDVSNQRNRLNQLLLLFVFIVIISFLLTLAVSFIMAKFLTRNLEKLRVGVEKVRNRDFSIQIEVTSKDEFGMVADTFNSMVREVKIYAETLERQKEAFHRFVPTQFLEFLNKESAVDIVLGDSSPYTMSVLFTDIRSFTTLSEQIGYANMFQFLNLYLNKMEPAIQRNHGFVDKYIGDAIMALFPDKIKKEPLHSGSNWKSGDSAIQAAIEMRKNLQEFNLERGKNGEKEIDIGIGIATGNLVLGIVGSETRLESTVIGETVNMASRIESLTSFYKVPVIVTDSTLLSTTNPSEYQTREIDTVIPKGAIKPIVLYEIFEGESDRVKNLKTKSLQFLQEGITNYKKGKFLSAYKYFQQGRATHPEDNIFKLYIDRCLQYKDNPPSSDWTGIWKFNQK